jgi:DNA-binding transcriptional LysR family regulator
MTMDRLETLESFVAVVETGSFTAAADRLEIAKSAVSRRVAALEERLGAQLIARTTRRLNLTDAGRAFYDRGVRILADLDEAESAVQAVQGELRGRLRIALPLSFGVRHMCAPIAEFMRQHPRVTFELDLNDRRVDLVEEGADLAIRIGHLGDSSLIARRLFESRIVVCASRDYLERRGTPASPEELADHDCMVYSNVGDPQRWRYTDDAGRDAAVDVNVVMRVSSGDFILDAAAHGLGICMLPAFIAGDAVRRGELVPILSDVVWPTAPAWALYPPARHLSRRVRAFIDFVAERFAGVPYWDEDCEN